MAPRLLALVVLATCGLLGACSSDLFHDTGWPTLCDRDPAACERPVQDGGEEDGSADGGADSSGDAAPEASPDGPGAEGGDATAGG